MIIEQLIRHDMETDEVQDVVDLSDYVEKWGHVSDLSAVDLAFAYGPGIL